jgi:putative membrane protein
MTTSELLLHAWRFDPIVVLGSAAALGAYAATPGRRTGSRAGYLTAAFVVLVVALASPVGALADGYLFSAHMLQHLLLLLVAPPLALLGLGTRNDSPTPSDRPLARTSALVAPGAWLAGVLAMWVWHTPSLCNAATTSNLVHLVQEVSLLLMGTWFFWPILAPKSEARLPPLAGIVYLFTACSACTLLGIAVTFSPIEICSAYLSPVDRLGALPLLRGGWGLTPERDQQIGGLLMWLPACLVYGAGIVGILARWYGEPDGAGQAIRPEHAP